MQQQITALKVGDRVVFEDAVDEQGTIIDIAGRSCMVETPTMIWVALLEELTPAATAAA